MPSTMVTVDGFPVPVEVAGPDKGSVVVLLGAAQNSATAYDAVCQRLHTASLRTVVIDPDPRLTAKSVVGIMDMLDVQWGLLVGDRIGGELAWELAATRLDRFIGLVVIDRGHPRVADQSGLVRDEHCPPVEMNTPALVSSPAARAVARASQRFVYGDFRLVELLGRRNAQEATAQLAAEIVLRTSTWGQTLSRAPRPGSRPGVLPGCLGRDSRRTPSRSAAARDWPAPAARWPQ